MAADKQIKAIGPYFYWVPTVLILSALAGCVWYLWWPYPPTTIILVRHAEKESGLNPSLTQDGQQRAIALKNLLRSTVLDAVFSTEFCRTAQTAEPTAIAHGLDLIIVTVSSNNLAFSNCFPSIQVQTKIIDASIGHEQKVADQILENYSGKRVLLIGHSNTIPKIVEAFGTTSLCPDLAPLDSQGQCHIPGNQFDNLYILNMYGRSRRDLLRLRYGE